MLYGIVKWVAWLAKSQFFRTVKLEGATPVEHGPVLLVSNHPNFLLDSTLILATHQRELWFLAKATLFKQSLVARILNSSHVLPVYRKQDVPEETYKNTETFERVVQKLREGGVVVIFPEGVSKSERRLQPLKTGTARIAFQAEEQSQFGLGLRIQPVGLTYADLDEFQSAVTIMYGEPIRVSDFREHFEKDGAEAVRMLTATIEAALSNVTVEVKNVEHSHLVEKLGKLFASRSAVDSEHERLSLIAKNVEQLSPRLPELRGKLEGRIDSYLMLTQYLRLDAAEPLELGTNRIFVFLILPFVLFGVLTHYLPYKVVGWLVKRRNLPPVQVASAKLVSGLYIYPLWYLFLCSAACMYLNSLGTVLLLLAVLLYSGHYVNKYFHQVRLYLLSLLWPGDRSPLEMLRLIRDQLIADLEELRVQ